MRTVTVRVIDTSKGTYWTKTRVGEGFKSFKFQANARAMSTNWVFWRIFGPINSFFSTVFENVVPVTASKAYKGNLFNGGTCLNKDSSGMRNYNRNLIAGIFEHDARSDPMLVCHVWIYKTCKENEKK